MALDPFFLTKLKKKKRKKKMDKKTKRKLIFEE
jgi:hypothetical protein